MGIALALLWLFASQPAAASLDDELIAAARRGDVAAAKALLDKGANVDAKARYDVTPLMTAALRGNLELVRLLVERGANVNIRDTFYKTTPLNMALGGDPPHYDVVEHLLAHGAEGGAAALSAGIEANRLSLVRAALGSGKVPGEALSDALLTADREGKPEIAALLREAGATAPRALEETVLKRYAGTWRGDDGFELTLGPENGMLAATMPGGRTLILIPIDETTFRPAGVDGTRLLFTVADGTATGAVLEMRGGRRELARAVEK